MPTLKQVGIVAAGLVVAVAMVLLGLWQMSSYRDSGQQVAIERTKMPVVALLDSVAADGTVDDIYARRVSVTGKYRGDGQVLVGQKWPLRVVTPLELADGRLIAVVRGAFSSEQVPPPPDGDVAIEGVFLASDAPKEAGTDMPAGTLASVRLASLAQQWPGRVIAGYITLPESDSLAQGLLAAPLELPEVKGSPQHSGYALQWWVFAGAAIAASLWLARGADPKRASVKSAAS